MYMCLPCFSFVLLDCIETKRVNTTQDVNNPNTTPDKMDIDTTPKEPATTTPTATTTGPARKLTSPSKSLPNGLQDCFVLLSPCPAFPTAPHNPQINTPINNAPQDNTPVLVNADSGVQPAVSNPTVSELANDQPAKPSPKKRKLTPEEKQYVLRLTFYSSSFWCAYSISRAREDAKKAKEEEKKLQAKQREDAKNKKEEEKRLAALAREEEKKKRDEEKRLKGKHSLSSPLSFPDFHM